MQSLYEETKFLMKKYNISANKNLGQNFLIDEEVLEAIVQMSGVSKEDLVIEIGPGLGTLTNLLLKDAGKVIAVELDFRMVKILNERFALYDNFEIINEDILKLNLNEIIKKEKEKNSIKNVKIVANLPYYITTPIIMNLLENELDLESITIMIQKEVAQRIVAEPGSKLSGAITYAVHYYSEPESIRIVPNNSFIPAPKVDSEVIKLKTRKNAPVVVKNKELFFKIIKASFMQRRKTLANALLNSKLFKSKDDVKEMFKELNINESVRGETLSMQEFAKIENFISNKFKKKYLNCQ